MKQVSWLRKWSLDSWVAARVAARLPIRLDVQLQEGMAETMGQSEDLSGTGMLARTAYKLGTMVKCETMLPGDCRPAG